MANKSVRITRKFEKVFQSVDVEERLDFFSLLVEVMAVQAKADGASFFEYDPETRFLEMRLHWKNGMVYEDEENLFADEIDCLQKALLEKEPQRVKVFSTYFLYIPFTLRSYGVRTGEEREDQAAFLRLERDAKNGNFTKKEMRTVETRLKDFLGNYYQTEFLALNRKYMKGLYIITNLSEILAHSLRVRESFEHILKGVQKYFGFDRIRLYLVNENRNRLEGNISVDIQGKVKHLEFERVPLERNSHSFADMILDRRIRPFFDKHTEKVLYVPLVIQNKIIGLMIVDNMLSQQDIEETEFALLKAFAGQISLVVDNIQLFERIEELSMNDELTRLPLRRYFNERFQEEIYRANRFNQPMALVWGDIDYFKQINDNYGHQIGDRVLREISRVVMANLRKIDFPCRWGGDEIVIMLPQASAGEALKFIQRLNEEIKAIKIEIPFSKYKRMSVSVSFGIAAFPDDASSGDELLRKADDALYWVKSRGKGNVALYGDIENEKKENL